jgi:hypothetical protein
MAKKEQLNHDEGNDAPDFGPDSPEFEQIWADSDLIGDDLGAINEEIAAPSPKKRKRKTDAKPKEPPKMPSEPPFHILRLTPSHSGKGSRYMVIDTWTKKVAPTPIQLRDNYGPGSFQVQDAQGATKKWAVAEFKRNPSEDAEQDAQDDAAQDHGPPPFRVAPPNPYAHPQAHPYPPQHAPQHQTQPGTHWAEPHRQQYQPPPVAHPGTSQPDPQLLGTFYRLDAAIQQISADCRRLQDELRSVTYELQQVPNRVAERVSTAIADAVDPFDQMSKVWAMSRDIAEGYGPGEKDSGGGMTDMIQAAVAALAARAPQPPPAIEPPQHQPPPVAHHAAPAPPTHQPPPPHQEGAQELPGMTPEIRAELQQEAAKRGIPWAEAIEMAKRQEWDAPQLLMAARATNAPPNGVPA